MPFLSCLCQLPNLNQVHQPEHIGTADGEESVKEGGRLRDPQGPDKCPFPPDTSGSGNCPSPLLPSTPFHPLTPSPPSPRKQSDGGCHPAVRATGKMPCLRPHCPDLTPGITGTASTSCSFTALSVKQEQQNLHERALGRQDCTRPSSGLCLAVRKCS